MKPYPDFRMKIGSIVSIVVASLAVCGMFVAFLTQASPYVTVAQAKSVGDRTVHVPGKLDKSTLKRDVLNGRVTFDITDADGNRMPVVYAGPPPANLGNATEVVVIGTMQGDSFHAKDMLIKCPTKYKDQPKAAGAVTAPAAAATY